MVPGRRGRSRRRRPGRWPIIIDFQVQDAARRRLPTGIRPGPRPLMPLGWHCSLVRQYRARLLVRPARAGSVQLELTRSRVPASGFCENSEVKASCVCPSPSLQGRTPVTVTVTAAGPDSDRPGAGVPRRNRAVTELILLRANPTCLAMAFPLICRNLPPNHDHRVMIAASRVRVRFKLARASKPAAPSRLGPEELLVDPRPGVAPSGTGMPPPPGRAASLHSSRVTSHPTRLTRGGPAASLPGTVTECH